MSSKHRYDQFQWECDFLKLDDVCRQIINNAEVLFPSQIDLRVVTGKVSRGQHYAALMARDTSSPDIDARDIGYKILAQGPSEGNRRASVMKLLDDVEKRIAKDIMDI